MDIRLIYNEIAIKQKEYYNLITENRKQYETQEEFEQNYYGLDEEKREELANLKSLAGETMKEMDLIGVVYTAEDLLNGFKEVQQCH